MDIHTNIPLKNYVTMKLGGPARFMATAGTPEEIASLCRNARTKNVTVAILGGGSNTLVDDEGFDGLVIRNAIKGITVLADEPGSTTIRFGAGENWDDCVDFTVQRNLTGIETLSAIPGTIGAAPVQNIGAYGQELADTFISLEAYDIDTNTFVALSANDCAFGYRDSIFRSSDIGRYVITSVTLKLSKDSIQPPFYAALQSYLDEHNITIFTPQIIRDAVTAIRTDKLPDPLVKPNTGSFFKNAIIEEWLLNELLVEYPDIPHYDLGEKQYKVPTGWLIETAGFKGQLLHGIRVHDRNALVLINESATSFDDLAAARQDIITGVQEKFRITITQEPLEL